MHDDWKYLETLADLRLCEYQHVKSNLLYSAQQLVVDCSSFSYNGLISMAFK